MNGRPHYLEWRLTWGWIENRRDGNGTRPIEYSDHATFSSEQQARERIDHLRNGRWLPPTTVEAWIDPIHVYRADIRPDQQLGPWHHVTTIGERIPIPTDHLHTHPAIKEPT